MFLKESKSIAGIIEFHRMNSKGIPQPMWTNIVYSARFRIYQLW